MNRLRIALKYIVSFAFLILLCLVPVGNQTAYAPEEKLPSYMIASSAEDTPPVTRPVSSDKERIRFLLLGTDERDDEASRSDTIILATYLPKEGKMNLLSIPRDTKVWIPSERKQDKINAAHAYGGMNGIKETVEQWSGLEIDHVAKVNFDGFQELVDGVGGVTVSPERAFAYGGDSFELGEQKINGEQALNYVRFRKDQDGDFGRIKRQQEVIQNTLTSILSDFSLTSLPSYLTFYTEHVQTDMSVFEMTSVAKKAYSNGLAIEGKTLPTQSNKINGIWFEETSVPAVTQSLAWLEDNSDEAFQVSLEKVSMEIISEDTGRGEGNEYVE